MLGMGVCDSFPSSPLTAHHHGLFSFKPAGLMYEEWHFCSHFCFLLNNFIWQADLILARTSSSALILNFLDCFPKFNFSRNLQIIYIFIFKDSVSLHNPSCSGTQSLALILSILACFLSLTFLGITGLLVCLLIYLLIHSFVCLDKFST